MQHKDLAYEANDVVVPKQPVPYMVQVNNAKLASQQLPADAKQVCETLLLQDVTRRKVSVAAPDGKIVTATLLMSGSLDLGPAGVLATAAPGSVEELARLKVLFALMFHGQEDAVLSGDVFHFPF